VSAGITPPRTAMETPQGDVNALVSKYGDRARKRPAKSANHYIVTHKFTPDGDVVDESNFNPKRDLSRLSVDDFRLLSALQEKKWDVKAAAESSGLDPAWAEKRLKKLSYFEFEDKKAQALAAVANPAFVTAKNVEGFFADNLSDGQRDHLKELAKITGAYKPTTNLNLNVNAFVKPLLSPEQEKATREFFDTIATEVPAA
jgi:hypothetical protein